MTDSGNAFSRDPMAQKWWTLPMALAWALWKTPEMVDCAWPAKTSEYFDGKPLSMATVMWYLRYDEPRLKEYMKRRNIVKRQSAEQQAHFALSQLTDALENDRIRAEGTEPGTEARRVIGHEDWRKADLGSIHVGSDLPEHDTLYVKRSHTPILFGVRVLREDVVREFGRDSATEAPDVGFLGEVVEERAGVAETPIGAPVETVSEAAQVPEVALVEPERTEPSADDQESPSTVAPVPEVDPLAFLREEIRRDINERIPSPKKPDPKRIEAANYLLIQAATGGDPERRRRDAPPESAQIRAAAPITRATYRAALASLKEAKLFDKYYARRIATDTDRK